MAAVAGEHDGHLAGRVLVEIELAPCSSRAAETDKMVEAMRIPADLAGIQLAEGKLLCVEVCTLDAESDRPWAMAHLSDSGRRRLRHTAEAACSTHLDVGAGQRGVEARPAGQARRGLGVTGVSGIAVDEREGVEIVRCQDAAESSEKEHMTQRHGEGGQSPD